VSLLVRTPPVEEVVLRRRAELIHTLLLDKIIYEKFQ